MQKSQERGFYQEERVVAKVPPGRPTSHLCVLDFDTWLCFQSRPMRCYAPSETAEDGSIPGPCQLPGRPTAPGPQRQFCMNKCIEHIIYNIIYIDLCIVHIISLAFNFRWLEAQKLLSLFSGEFETRLLLLNRLLIKKQSLMNINYLLSHFELSLLWEEAEQFLWMSPGVQFLVSE